MRPDDPYDQWEDEHDTGDRWDVPHRRHTGSLLGHAWRSGIPTIAGSVTIAWIATGWPSDPIIGLVAMLCAAAATAAAGLWAWRRWGNGPTSINRRIPASFEAAESGIDTPRGEPKRADRRQQTRLRNTIVALAGISLVAGIIGSINLNPTGTPAGRDTGMLVTDEQTAEQLRQLDATVRGTAGNTTSEALRQAWMTYAGNGRRGNIEIVGVLREQAWVTIYNPDGTTVTACLNFSIPAQPSAIVPCLGQVNRVGPGTGVIGR